MKALIVAESESVLSSSARFLGERGCAVIKYRWLMKALDNLEEIDPQIIIISAMDYPRHWKTFVQFINSTFLNEKPHIFLFSSDMMGENEIRKAKWLGVKAILKDFDLQEDKDMLNAVIPVPLQSSTQAKNQNNEIKHFKTPPPLKVNTTKESSTKAVSEPLAISEESLKIMLTNPSNGVMITGKVLLIKGNSILYMCDNTNALVNLKVGDCIHNCMIKKQNKVYKKTCTILSINKTELQLEIQKWE